MNYKALLEAIKLPLRLLVLSLLPFLATHFTSLGYWWATATSGFLIVLDKFLHEVWKENDRVGIKGLVPF